MIICSSYIESDNEFEKYNCSKDLQEIIYQADFYLVHSDDKICIDINIGYVDRGYIPYYFRIFNSPNIETATKCARIKLSKHCYTYGDQYKDNWILSDEEKKYLINVLLKEEKFNGCEYISIWKQMIEVFKSFIYGIKNNRKHYNYLCKLSNKMPDYTQL